ncbi:unnamed protein product [Owenia fusiformis]|uniref:tRNA (34-2'-O)-methyltransferase regulator WDR6 n=1 Tax=Owenia fusiformis TaxID=6347 RepID=A0A8S4NN45_OWEFU|nr:unnamed protein product [Owenia fusiformis]
MLVLAVCGSVILVNKQGTKIQGVTLFEKHIYTGKVFSVKWLSEESVLTSGPEGEIIRWSVDANLGEVERKDVWILPTSKQRWTSAATWIQQYELLIVGDRVGSVHVYKKSEKNAVQSFFKVHGQGGTTDVHYHQGSVYTAGRDGCYRQYSITQNATLHLLYHQKVAKGFEWIERLIFSNSQMSVLGFHNDKFVCYDVANSERKVALQCGGGHRAWDYSQRGTDVRFVCVKAGTVQLHRATINTAHKTLKSSLHGRELTCVKHLCSIQTPGGTTVSVCVTGSEDTFINIVAINQNDDDLCQLTVKERLQGHVSSVRCLATSPSAISIDKKCVETSSTTSPHSMILFSGGGRAQIKVWCINIFTAMSSISENGTKNNAREVQCQYELLTSYTMSQSLKRQKHWRSTQVDSNPETRFMDVTACNLGESLKNDDLHGFHFLAAGCSDGFLRFYSFQEKTNNLTLVGDSDFHQHCVLTIGHEVITIDGAPSLIVYSGGTDGKIALWDISKIFSKTTEKSELTLDADISPVLILPAHQSGVNSICIRQVHDSEYVVASGGDDNSLAIHLLTATQKSESLQRNTFQLTLSVIKRCVQLSAHGAQITGIQALEGGDIITASIDQRLNVWRISPDFKKIDCILSRYVSVADIASMDLSNVNITNEDSSSKWQDQTVVVCGEGFQLLKLRGIVVKRTHHKENTTYGKYYI